MIDDIIFGGTASNDITNEFILEIPSISGGQILSYSLDGLNYDFIQGNGESITIIIS